MGCRLSVVPAQAGTSVLNILGSCLRRNDGENTFTIMYDYPEGRGEGGDYIVYNCPNQTL